MLSSPNVIIAGGGSVGLTAANFLKRYGLSTCILERRPVMTEHPQAHFINCRSMEIFRNISMNSGSLSEAVASKCPDYDYARFSYTNYILDGEDFGTVNHDHGLPGLSPSTVAHVPQHALLSLLEESYVGNEDSQILYNSEVCNVTSTPDRGFQVTANTNGERKEYQCDYFIDCTGANSRFHESELQNNEFKHKNTQVENLISVHFFSPEMGKQILEKHRETMLFFLFNPYSAYVLICYNLRTGEFVAQIPYFPDCESMSDYSEEYCKDLLINSLSRDTRPLNADQIEVKSINSWTMNTFVAENYLWNDANGFFAGDSAHQFPPSGGFGMNTGIQDAHNLAWKIALHRDIQENSPSGSMKEKFLSDLLKSYESERKRIAVINSERSVRNYEVMLQVPQILGISPGIGRTIGGILSSLPFVNKYEIFKAARKTGLQHLDNISASQRNSLKDLFENRADTLQLQFQDEDIGFQYEIPEDNLLLDQDCSLAGKRLQHYYTDKEESVSSLDTRDALDVGKIQFRLLVGDGQNLSVDELVLKMCPSFFPIHDFLSKNSSKYSMKVEERSPFNGIVVRPDDIIWGGNQ